MPSKGAMPEVWRERSQLSPQRPATSPGRAIFIMLLSLVITPITLTR